MVLIDLDSAIPDAGATQFPDLLMSAESDADDDIYSVDSLRDVSLPDDDALLDELLNDDDDNDDVSASSERRDGADDHNGHDPHHPYKERSTSCDNKPINFTSNTKHEVAKPSMVNYRTKKSTPSDNTSTTRSDEDYSDEDHHSQVEKIVVYDLVAGYDNASEVSSMDPSEDGAVAGGDDEYSQDSDDQDAVEDDDEEDQESVTNLLERAHDRIAMQHLQEEIAKLNEVIEKKNEEIEHISGQLRRAVATKTDLVIAHTELERHHENNLSLKEQDVQVLKKEKVSLEEQKSKIERELLDELVKLTDQLKATKKGHRQELEDWERLHRNEMLEKDLQIAQLTEEIRTLQGFDNMKNKKGTGMKVVFRKN